METRIITQIKVYLLILNPMTDTVESRRIVAISTDKGKLIEWYNDQKAPEVWKDGQWSKTFKKDSPLEWFNSLYGHFTPDTFGHGIFEDWVEQNEYNQSSHFKVPE